MKQLQIAQYVLLAGTFVGLIILIFSRSELNSFTPVMTAEYPVVDAKQTPVDSQESVAIKKTHKSKQPTKTSATQQDNSITHRYFEAEGDVNLAQRTANEALLQQSDSIPDNATAFIRSPQKSDSLQQPASQPEPFNPFLNDQSIVTREASLSVHKYEDSQQSILRSPQHRRITENEQSLAVENQMKRWNAMTTRPSHQQEIDADSPLQFSGKPSPTEYRLDSIRQELARLATSTVTGYHQDIQATMNQLHQLQTNMRIDDLNNQLTRLREISSEESLLRTANSRTPSQRYRGKRYFFISRPQVTTTETLSAEKNE